MLGLPDEAIIDTQWLRLAQDIGMFNNYPWGLLVWEATYDSIVLIVNSWATQNVRSKTTMLRPANHTFVLRGFAFAAQLWIYECVNILGHLYGRELDEDLVPRMLRWTTRTQPDDATNRLHLMSTRSNRLPSVPVTLEPSHKEKDCSYYKSLIEITRAAQPVQIVDGNYSKNGEGQNTVQATSAVVENENSTVLRQGGLTQILSNMVAAATSQLKIDIMTGIKRPRNNIAEELEIHYKILMEELRAQREILCQNEEAPTDINADNQVWDKLKFGWH